MEQAALQKTNVTKYGIQATYTIPMHCINCQTVSGKVWNLWILNTYFIYSPSFICSISLVTSCLLPYFIILGWRSKPPTQPVADAVVSVVMKSSQSAFSYNGNTIATPDVPVRCIC